MSINNNKVDTSNIMTEDDYKLMQEIKNIKRQLFSFIDMKVLINKIIEIVEESELVSFKNERSKKFIDTKRPLFHLTIDIEKSMVKYKKTKFKSENDEASFYSSVLFDEVINKISLFIKTSLDSPEAEKILDKRLFKDTNDEDIKLLNKLSVLSTLYGIRLESINKNNVTLEILS